MLPSKLCKFSVFYLLESILLISNTDAAFHARKSVESDLETIKIIARNELKNESDTNKWDKIQITETSLNSTEYMDPFANVRKRNKSLAPDRLLWENENDREKVESNPMQMIYWYYNKMMAVILGITFGITLNLENAKEILKQPIAPSIGIFCKFMLSPFVRWPDHFCLYLSFHQLLIFGFSFFSWRTHNELMAFNGFGLRCNES